MLNRYFSKQQSIRSKLLTLIIGITALSLVTANVIQLVSEYMTSRYRTTGHLENVTRIAQEKINDYIKTGEPEKIPDFMDSFEFDPYIDRACYYKQKTLAAAFITPEAIEEYGDEALCPQKKPSASSYENDLTHINDFVTIIDSLGRHSGTLFIKYDLDRDIAYLMQKAFISLISF